MNITADALTRTRAESQADVAPRAPLANALRAMAVTFGPSAALDALLAASTATSLIGAVAPAKHIPRAVRVAAVLGALAPWAYLAAARPRLLGWGATDREIAQALPGDDIIPEPVWSSTRAIGIDAPAETVWPWLVQMGQDRGGLYSYAWLENLAGLEFHNADRIVPEWQHITAGDVVRFAPGQDTMRVARLEPGRALIWRIATPSGEQPSGAFDATWAFVLEPVADNRTRLIQRFRFTARPRRWAGLAYTLLIEIPHFVMEFGMLRGIKLRAERLG